MILLDTNVVVAFLNGDNSTLKRIKDDIDRIEGLKVEVWSK